VSHPVRAFAARAALLAAIATAAPLAEAGAQRRPPAQPPGAGLAAVDSTVTFERGLARIVKRQLGLTDAQLVHLQQVDRQFRQRRLATQRDEVRTRRAIRRALAPGAATTDAAPLDTLLDRMVSLQVDRAQLIRQEQQELRTFLTPTQRARYIGIQEFLRKRAEEMRAGRRGADDSVARTRRRLRP
jgi:Spy/CpxP family protein refolding chaperone